MPIAPGGPILGSTFSSSGPPASHKASHVSGGGDAFAAADLIEAIVKRLQTTTGPTTLLMGAVADGEFLKRVGSALVGAAAGDVQVSKFFADTLEIPNNADWAVNAFAAPGADSNNNGLGIRAFDDTVEEGVGFSESVPAGKTNIVLKFRARAEVGPPAARTVGLKLYQRGLPDNAAVEAWSAGLVLTDIDIPTTNEFFQYDEQTITLASLGITAGEMTQFELTRINPTGGTELVGDWDLALILVSFT